MPQIEDASAMQMQSVVSRYVEAHRAEAQGVRAELDQLRTLLNDAVARLTTTFETMCVLSARPQLVESSPGDVASFEKLRGRLNEAATALQFHDIATQILAQSMTRIEAIEQMTGRLGQLPGGSLGELDQAWMCSPVSRPSAVSQSRMTAGAVELF
jgi:hypothetical protein